MDNPKAFLIQAFYEVNTISNDVMSNQQDLSEDDLVAKLAECVKLITTHTREHGWLKDSLTNKQELIID